MGLNRYSSALDADELKEAFMNLDPSLDNVKSLKLAKSILKNKDKIDVKELVQTVGCPPGDMS